MIGYFTVSGHIYLKSGDTRGSSVELVLRCNAFHRSSEQNPGKIFCCEADQSSEDLIAIIRIKKDVFDKAVAATGIKICEGLTIAQM